MGLPTSLKRYIAISLFQVPLPDTRHPWVLSFTALSDISHLYIHHKRNLEPIDTKPPQQQKQQQLLLLSLPHPQREEGVKLYILVPLAPPSSPENPGRLRMERKAELSLQEIKHEMKTTFSD